MTLSQVSNLSFLNASAFKPQLIQENPAAFQALHFAPIIPLLYSTEDCRFVCSTAYTECIKHCIDLTIESGYEACLRECELKKTNCLRGCPKEDKAQKFVLDTRFLNYGVSFKKRTLVPLNKNYIKLVKV